MSNEIVSYECPIAGNTHSIPGPDVRLLKVGDGGFVAACDCSEESLEDVDDPPHPTVDHMVNIYADDPSPEEWIALENAANGWHDTNRWESPEDGEGTWGQRRAQFRDQIQDLVDEDDGRDLGDREDRLARKVPCPDCSVDEGQKCKRPSGHSVRTSHSDRKDLARSRGLLPEDDSGTPHAATQAEIGEWAT